MQFNTGGKIVAGLILAAWASFVQGADGPVAPTITDDNAYFFYEAHAEIPTSHANLAKLMSSDYRTAPDEFTAHELLQKMEPVIERRIKEAGEAATVMIKIGAELPNYDFDKNGFPTSITETTFVPFTGNYSARFSNVADLTFVPVSADAAKLLAGRLSRNRSCYLKIFGSIEKSAEETINNSSQKVITISASRISIELENGTPVGEKKLK